MNPEREARERLVTHLRLGADGIDGVAPAGTATNMRQAANEIEDLAKFKAFNDERFKRKLQKVLADAVHDFIEEESGWEPRISFVTDPDMLGFGLDVSSPALVIELEVRVPRRNIDENLLPFGG